MSPTQRHLGSETLKDAPLFILQSLDAKEKD